MKLAVAGVALGMAVAAAMVPVPASAGPPLQSEPPRRPDGRLVPRGWVHCDSSIGTVAPAPVCSEDWPCTELLPTYRLLDPPVFEIDTASDEPFCGTGDRGIGLGRPIYDDGPPQIWVDGDGVSRSRCEVVPTGQPPAIGWPVVVWIPGSGGHAGSVYDTTSLRGKTAGVVLGTEPDRPGFILVSIQPRNLHWPTTDPQDGTKHDSYYRDLASPSTNQDIAHLDAVIDGLTMRGLADPSRIYLMGWSNGGRFAALYGIARHETTTPGGNRVAAVALYSSGDPFENIAHGRYPSCKQDPYPSSRLPLYLISRTCDAVACSEAQDQRFRRDGSVTTPGNVASTWVDNLHERIGDPNVSWQRITSSGSAASWCAPAGLCSVVVAVLNHLHWPDGVEDGGGEDWEPEMLGFLREHPLAAPFASSPADSE